MGLAQSQNNKNANQPRPQAYTLQAPVQAPLYGYKLQNAAKEGAAIYPHFTDGEMEAQRGLVTWPRSHS